MFQVTSPPQIGHNEGQQQQLPLCHIFLFSYLVFCTMVDLKVETILLQDLPNLKIGKQPKDK